MDQENEMEMNEMDAAAQDVPAEPAGSETPVTADVERVETDAGGGNHFEGDPDMKAMLDSLTEDDTGDSDTPAPAEEEPEAGDPDNPPEADADKEPENEEEEEAAILAEVKSDRGKDRIRRMLDERKQLRDDQRAVLDLVSQVNVTPAEFAQTMEYNRLVASGDEKSMRLALDMLESQRDMICKRLGIAAPGVNLFSDFPDLKEAVDSFEMGEDKAIELASRRRRDMEQEQAARQRQAEERAYQENDARLKVLDKQASAWFRTKQGDIDFEAKSKRILEVFNDPGKFKTFVNTYSPEQWLPAIQMMYENMIVPARPPVRVTQPLQSRPRNLGRPTEGMNERDIILNRMDELGI